MEVAKEKAGKAGVAIAAGSKVAAAKTAEFSKKAWGVTAEWAKKQNENLKDAKLGDKFKGLFKKKNDEEKEWSKGLDSSAPLAEGAAANTVVEEKKEEPAATQQ